MNSSPFADLHAVTKSPESSPQETPPLRPRSMPTPLRPKTMPTLPVFGAPNLNDDKDIVLSEVVIDRLRFKEVSSRVIFSHGQNTFALDKNSFVWAEGRGISCIPSKNVARKD